MVDDDAHTPGDGAPATDQVAREAGTRPGPMERLRRRSPEGLRRMSTDAWTTMLVCVGVIGGLALGFLLGSIPSGLEQAVTPVARPTHAASPTPTVTVTATYMLPPSPPPGLAGREAPESDDSRPDVRTHWETGGLAGTFGHVGTLSATTSRGFARKVAEEYNASGADGDAARVTATSEATGERVTMSCSPRRNGSVVCRGGRNARVVLWR